MQLAGTDLRDEDLFATLAALASYYVTRVDLRRVVQVIESLRKAAEHGRQWFVPVIEEYTGLLALLRGEFDAASAHLETAIAGLAAADMQNTSIADADWFVVSEPLVYTHVTSR